MGYMDPARRKWVLGQNNGSLVLFDCDTTSVMNDLEVGKTYFNRFRGFQLWLAEAVAQ